MSVRCFWLEPTERCKRSLRRYRSSSKPKDPCSAAATFATHPEYAYHNAHAPIEEGYARKNVTGSNPDEWTWDVGPKDEPAHDDPRWPTNCACGYVFQANDEWQVFTEVIYRRTDTGEDTTIRSAPPGAMWDAAWLYTMYGPTQDGRVIIVRCPDGDDWTIDGRASNCTNPSDRVHKCWVRHGQPPMLTVDKNGITCNAGGGSIMTSKYHGFLRNGEFSPSI